MEGAMIIRKDISTPADSEASGSLKKYKAKFAKKAVSSGAKFSQFGQSAKLRNWPQNPEKFMEEIF